MKKSCLAHGMPCIEFAVGSKLKNVIESEKLGAVDSRINIQPVNAKHFFRIAQKKKYKGFLWIPHVNTSNCNCCETNSSSTQKWSANTTSRIGFENFETFMKGKPSYTREKLLKKVPKEYHSNIKVFIKQDANILSNHRLEDHKIELLEGKQAYFMRNYKPLSEQEAEAIKKYINKHLGKDFIRPSLLAAAAPMLLVKTSSGGLRFCVDYRALNKITVKNWYAIALINKMLGKLSNAAHFTKFDIIHAFNKI